MKNLLIMLIAGVIIVSCSGCSAMLNLKFDGKNWNIGIGGEVPEIPLVDYERDFLE